MNKRWFVSASVLLLAFVFVTACSSPAPSSPTSTSVAPSLVPLGAPSLAPTVEATLPPTLEPATAATATTAATAVSPTTAAATPTGAPTGTGGTPVPGSACTNVATFVSDVTVPDKTVVAPGQTFNKTWRLANTGTCTWGAGYALAFVSGQAMTTTTRLPLSQTGSRATVDLTVPMTAPTAPGTYQGFWELRGPKGTRFGPPVWALIQVAGTPAAAPTLSPGATSSLGVYVTQLQLDPVQPSFNEPLGFRVTMRNMSPGAQTLRWFVKLYQCTETPCSEDHLKSSISNLERSFGESTIVESTVPPGTVQVAVPPHWIAGAGACVYTAVPHFLEPVGQGVMALLKPDGIPLYYTFDVCH